MYILLYIYICACVRVVIYLCACVKNIFVCVRVRAHAKLFAVYTMQHIFEHIYVTYIFSYKFVCARELHIYLERTFAWS